MSDNSSHILQALQVEQLDSYLFRGETPATEWPRIFGGQVLAQSMNAAARTIPVERLLHSFHAYFIRPGNPQKNIIFEVDPVRDGGSFTSRHVTAKQDNKAIFNCSYSFVTQSDGYQHQQPMPAVPAPEELESQAEVSARMVAKYPGRYRGMIDFPEFDMRHVVNIDPFEPQLRPPVRATWLRYKPAIDRDPLLNMTLLAYVSDIGLLATAFLPHGITFHNQLVQPASLDHAMWFHEPCDMNDWILYHSESHWSAHGRGLNIGKLYRRDGTLVATAVQEGLMRPVKKKPVQ